jgi:hypothetical protein
VNQALWCLRPGVIALLCGALPALAEELTKFSGRKVFAGEPEHTLVGGSLMVQPLRNGYIRGVARGPFPVTPSHADSFLL